MLFKVRSSKVLNDCPKSRTVAGPPQTPNPPRSPAQASASVQFATRSLQPVAKHRTRAPSRTRAPKRAKNFAAGSLGRERQSRGLKTKYPRPKTGAEGGKRALLGGPLGRLTPTRCTRFGGMQGPRKRYRAKRRKTSAGRRARRGCCDLRFEVACSKGPRFRRLRAPSGRSAPSTHANLPAAITAVNHSGGATSVRAAAYAADRAWLRGRTSGHRRGPACVEPSARPEAKTRSG